MKKLTIAWNFLKGKKTFILAASAAVYGLGVKYNMWGPPPAWLDLLWAAGTSASLRHAITATDDPASVVSAAEQPTKLASPKDQA